MLPSHGKLECRACFQSTASDAMSPHPDWRIINDPGAWGSTSPEVLVLGFSKGATQAGIYQSGKFEDIAFAGMRPRLSQVLQAMKLLPLNETADQRISDPNSNISFGSLIRCSVSRRDVKASAKMGREVFACTGPLISKSFSEIPDVIRTCTTRYLRDLPSSLRLVVFLGNTDSYVKRCQELVQSLYPDTFSRVNQMAVKADGRIWVHLAHPSGLNGHFNDWLDTDLGPGLKRVQAEHAIAEAQPFI
jgi:hypothetical protein